MGRIVDGWLMKDLIVYRGLQRGGAVGKGFVVTVPDIENVGADWLNQLEDSLRVLLLSLKDTMRMQFRWTVDSDYRNELLHYYKETEEKSQTGWEERNRHERFTRYWKKMERKELRRERLFIYLTSKVDTSTAPKGAKGGQKFYDYLLGAVGAEMEHYHGILSQLIGSMGGKVEPMDDLMHFQDMYRFFNPSALENAELDYEELLEAGQGNSFCDLCFNGEGSHANGQAGHGFYMDGHYHGLLVLKTLPKQTHMGMVRQLTGLPMLDYSITANIGSIPIDDEINQAEKDMEKLAYSAHKPRIAAMMGKLDERVKRLMSNQVTPFEVQYVIRCWDKTPEGLGAKLSALKNTVSKMGGAQTYEPALPTSARNFWNATVPGWTFDSYKDLKLYIEDVNLADLLPVSATPTGDLAEAEAIYDGANSNLVGITTFVGREGAKRPEHGIMFGSSGGGKSVLTIDILSQISSYYGFIGIVEEGLSYNFFTRLLGSEPIIVQPQGNLTFNYLDTKGLPLGPLQKGGAVAMLQIMIGVTGDVDKDRKRRALLSSYVERLYTDKFETWKGRQPEQAERAARHSLLIDNYLRDNMPPGSTDLDAFISLREIGNDDKERFEEMLDTVEGVEKRLGGGEGYDKLMAVAYSYIPPEEMPTHGQFQELMVLESMQHGAAEDLEIIASLLEPWNATGEYGAILDGVNNVHIADRRVAHFELGYIPEQAAELRTVAAFLITNEMRNAIMNKPRGIRKAIILEELSAFLAVPDGERITREFYERMRKYNAWVFSIIQQYDRIRNHPVRSSVMGNSRLMFMLKQPDRSDLDHICEAFPLPEITRQEVGRFPDPSEMKKDPYGGFAYYHAAEGRPNIALGRHYATGEMLMASSTSGEAFDKNMGLLKEYEGDVFELVTTEGNS